MVEHIVALFPRLHTAPFSVTSPPDPVYNCIGWAAGDIGSWWWPLDDPRESHWPDGVPRMVTLDAFRDAFATLGYVLCRSDAAEAGIEKVALFANGLGIPTHAARQLPGGRWTSKLGRAEDIEHDLRDLEGDLYGTVVLVMMRPLSMTRVSE